jgi:hypothetical protein
VRSIRRASGERSARRSGGAAARSVTCPLRAVGAARPPRRTACDGAPQRRGSPSIIDGFALVRPYEDCGFVPCARCSAEYQACERERRSIAASGAVRMLKPNCCVIMFQWSVNRVNGLSPIYFGIVSALLGELAIVAVVEALRALQKQSVIGEVEGEHEVSQRSVTDVSTVIAIRKSAGRTEHDIGIAIE